jgi:uncharacterized circularly permuted ATP-grasp superfamily protein
MGDLFSSYRLAATLGQPAWDEMFAAPGDVRGPSEGLHAALQGLTPEAFDERCATRDRAFRDRGITFQLSGEERPFPLDLVPRIIPADEWATIEAGVIQRVRALEAFLFDVYGEGRILNDGVVPRSLVTTSEHFQRASYGINPPNGVRIHVAGIDIVRAADGGFRVLEDNVRVPSGISYVVENRRMMTRVFPELFRSHHVRPVNAYPARLLEALRAAAPHDRPNPTVVVLTPGIYNSAYFEHTFLARQMGVELVEGRDLSCRNDVVYMRTTEGERRVDVIYRRVDDDYLDPLQFRPNSMLGCPGLLNAARAGNVVLANAIGNGVADDKLVYTYVPDMIRYYLGESPVLANVETYRLADPEQFAYAMAHLDQLVIKPVSGSGGYGILIGPQATDRELAEARAAIESSPRNWIAQEPVTLSTVPTGVGTGFAPRHVDLRPFAVNDGNEIWVVPGGLTRVALPEGGMVVNSSQGGGSKDTWVLAAPHPAAFDRRRLGRTEGDGAPIRSDRVAVDGHRLDLGPGLAIDLDQSQQQQQQQQQQPGGSRC